MKAEFKMLHNGVPLYTAMSIEWTMDFYEAIADTNVIDMAMADARNLCGISNISAAVAVSDTVRGYAIVSGLFAIILSLLGA